MQFLRKPKTILSFFLSLGFISACATSNLSPIAGPPVSKSVILGQTRIPPFTAKSSLNEKDIRQKMNRFQAILARGATLGPSDWKLHDEILNAYVQIKNQKLTANQITVPAHSRLKLGLPSFCLNSSRASPSDAEHFVWKKADPKIPYYREVLKFSATHPKIASQDEIQTLLWNLQNETYWENYPDHLKAILQQIDPRASFNLPSKLKNTVKNGITNFVTNQIPFGSEAQDAIDFVKGEYYRFEDIRRSIEQMKSNYPLETSDDLEAVPDSPLYAETESQGFSQQTVTFYNPSNQPTTLDLTEYYLEPKRKDVQRIALTLPSVSQAPSLLADLEQLLYGNMLRLGIGLTPGLNDIADLYELVFGKDFVSQQTLAWDERIASGIGIALGNGEAYRHAKRWVSAPEKYLPRFESEMERAAGRNLGSAGTSETFSKLPEIQSYKEAYEKALDYRGTQELSELLRSNPNINRQQRVEVIRSFEAADLRRRVLKEEQAVYRWHNDAGSAQQLGRFVSPTEITDLETARRVFALPPENQLKHLDQFKLAKGTLVFEGKIAPNFGNPGGGRQIFITGDLNKALHFERRIK